MNTISIKSVKELVYEAKKGEKATVVVTAGGYSYEESMKVFRINYTERFEKEVATVPVGEFAVPPQVPMINQSYGNKEISSSEYDAKFAELSAANNFPDTVNGSENVIFVLMNLVLEEFKAGKYYGSLSTDWVLNAQ